MGSEEEGHVMSIALLEPHVRNDPAALFEVLDGVEVEMAPMSLYAEKVALRLFTRLSVFLEHNDLGEVQHECLFSLPLPVKRSRRPDVSFVSYSRWPKNKPIPSRGNSWQVVPELAVEVVSPNDYVEEVVEKIGEYFRSGVGVVWVIYPIVKLVHVYHSYTEIRGLTETDELDGGEVLPGFRFAVSLLFPPTIPDESPASDQ
jgi:Uma2 family endonuclease